MSFRLFTGYFALLWYLVIVLISLVGFAEILFKYNSRKYLKADVNRRARSKTDTYEGVTILRPIKGIDPELYSCLKSSFDQDYPADKLQIIFCIDDPQDAAIGVIRKLMLEYPHIDSHIEFSDSFDAKTKRSLDYFGPNPKVNNLAKGFRNPKFDILWIMDSNVWASSNILKNSVLTLNENLNNGKQLNERRKVRLVHHVPLALSINNSSNNTDMEYSLSPTQSCDSFARLTHDAHRKLPSRRPRFLKKLGARLDEMFLFTSHSKFYVALNKLSIGACVNGKSNIYRRSDLDVSVVNIPSKKSSFFNDDAVMEDARRISSKGPGHAIEFFSRYIGEDNMIAISLWDNLDSRTGQTTDLVVQPLSGVDNSINDYVNRRVRWLRVRKYMVMMATLVEPTTESIICGLIGNYALSTIFYGRIFTLWIFLIHITIWVIIDYIQYYTLVFNITSSNNCTNQPDWLRNIPPLKRSFASWLYIWVIRELLALPIWIIAMAGHEIDWRGTPFRIKQDLTAEEL